MKTILIAGYRGLIGSELSRHLKGHKVLAARREDFQLSDTAFIRKFESADIIMNFAGYPIIKRWTPGNRKKILDSRVETTRKFGRIIQGGTPKERHYIAASAIGIYPETGSHTESSTQRSDGFMTDIIEAWERETNLLVSKNTSVSILRLGIVLSKQGGMLKRLLPLFKLGLGAKIGDGKQAFSWIHIKDLLRAIDYIIERKGGGIYNLVSPGVCSNSDFTIELGRAVNRSAWLWVPEFALRIKYGKAASIITSGQTVLPERLQKEGFLFNYPDLQEALKDIVN